MNRRNVLQLAAALPVVALLPKVAEAETLPETKLPYFVAGTDLMFSRTHGFMTRHDQVMGFFLALEEARCVVDISHLTFHGGGPEVDLDVSRMTSVTTATDYVLGVVEQQQIGPRCDMVSLGVYFRGTCAKALALDEALYARNSTRWNRRPNGLAQMREEYALYAADMPQAWRGEFLELSRNA